MSDGNKMFTGAKNLGKKVPKWAWYVSGGVGVAAGIYYFRNRAGAAGGNTAASAAGATDGAVGYTDAAATPNPAIVVGQPPGAVGSAELNTDIPSATLDVFGGVIDSLTGLLGGARQDQAAILQILAGAGSPQAGAGNTGGVVTVNPPSSPGKKKPRPNPAGKLDPGYRAGATVDMGPNARKTFRGAVGWARIGDGGKGADHWIDVHVRFCNKLERWRVRPNAKGSPWMKTWHAARPEICK